VVPRVFPTPHLEDAGESRRRKRCSNSRQLREGIPMATPVFDGAAKRKSATCSKWPDFRTPARSRCGRHDRRGVSHSRSPSVHLHVEAAHLVDDKIHARSNRTVLAHHAAAARRQGQFGGPALRRNGKFGALEAYGAAHKFSRNADAKSDDVYAAQNLRAIVRVSPGSRPGVPESFNVLVRELQSLCLDVELMKRKTGGKKAAPISGHRPNRFC